MEHFQLITERLLIEPFTAADAPFMLKLVNTDDWKKHISDGGIDTLEKAENYIKRALQSQYEQFGFGLYKTSLKENNTPIGMCGLVKRGYLDGPDLGFAILPHYYKQGYTLEASKAIFTHAKNEHKLKMLYAVTSPDNTASQLLLKKLGFEEDDNIEVKKSVVFRVDLV